MKNIQKIWLNIKQNLYRYISYNCNINSVTNFLDPDIFGIFYWNFLLNILYKQFFSTIV